jgi:hypothetical protein
MDKLEQHTKVVMKELRAKNKKNLALQKTTTVFFSILLTKATGKDLLKKLLFIPRKSVRADYTYVRKEAFYYAVAQEYDVKIGAIEKKYINELMRSMGIVSKKMENSMYFCDVLIKNEEKYPLLITYPYRKYKKLQTLKEFKIPPSAEKPNEVIDLNKDVCKHCGSVYTKQIAEIAA